MEDIEYEGYRVTSSTACVLEENGYWKVTQKIIHERKEIGKDWEKREAVMNSYSKDMQEAISTSYLSIATYLNTVGGDLFKEDDEKKGLLN